MSCEDSDKPFLDQVARIAARLATSSEEMARLLSHINYKLVGSGGLAVHSGGSPGEPEDFGRLVAMVQRGVDDDNLCAHTRNFLNTVLSRLQRTAEAGTYTYSVVKIAPSPAAAMP